MKRASLPLDADAVSFDYAPTTLVIEVRAEGPVWSGAADESIGLDNVRVSLADVSRTQAPPAVVALLPVTVQPLRVSSPSERCRFRLSSCCWLCTSSSRWSRGRSARPRRRRR